MNRRDSRRTDNESGTSTLEVAGLVVVCAMVMMVLVQGGLALYGVTATETAARHAARAYSLDQDPGVAAAAALPGWLAPTVSTFGPGHGVQVETSVPQVVPGMNLTVVRSAVMP